MFDPTLGRWVTVDPKGFNAGDPNLFRYCLNNPTNLRDSSGLDPLDPGDLWRTQLQQVAVEKWNFRKQTWQDDGKTCTGDVKVEVVGFRTFRTFPGDNDPANFRILLQIKYIFTNVECGKPCQKIVPVPDRIYYENSRPIQGIFLHGEIKTFTFKYNPASYNKFREEFLEKIYALKPDPNTKPKNPKPNM